MREGSSSPVATFDTKAKDMEHGRAMASNDHQLIAHTKDGQDRKPEHYGNDHNPPRDEKH